ncbi:MAG: 4Fe-4S binding protein [Schaedlerella sp.]|nr:4Fe-4S binding protein [Schaedlerella sp.]
MMKWMKEKKRRLTQVICALLYNCNFAGFVDGKIYKGGAKMVCVPGLNCYSCPGAIASCPIGSLQSSLVSAKYKLPYYILGMLLLMGVVFGRFICGFLCPFGFFQELLYKIPTKKISKGRWSEWLSCLKYIILVVFAVAIPLTMAVPGFCKYICPAGTLDAGIPLLVMNEELRQMVGGLFFWKIFLLALIVGTAIFIFRSFCRFLCPLGAFYSFFHKIAFVGVKIDGEKCNGCGKCIRKCKMDVKKVGDQECVQCGECIKCCPTNALSFKMCE